MMMEHISKYCYLLSLSLYETTYEAGKLYIAMPPLYKVEFNRGGENTYGIKKS